MTWFSTNAFRFALPGDAWLEQTIHMFRPKNDPRSAFAISRSEPAPDGDDSIERALKMLPKGPYDERTILRRELREVGAVDAEDVSLFARSGASGEYYRILCLPYYGRLLSFQWAGPIAARDEVDARVERALDTLRFRGPW